MTDRITLDATVEQAEDSAACGIIIPTDNVVRWFGRKSRVPVQVTIKDYTYRSSLSPMGGCHVLPVNAEVRGAANIRAGDKVAVHLQEDRTERTVDVPDDLARALEKAGARPVFDRMSFTHRKEWVKAVLDAKLPETRSKRIADCIGAIGAPAKNTKSKRTKPS